MAAAEIKVTVHVLGFEACREGNLMGECVLSEGHEHRESEHRTPGGETVPVQWAHVDRHGTHWGVSGKV